jgi:RHS repeat-associated protein
VTVNDKKLGVSSNNSTVDYFNPQVVSAQDYYPFGMLQPGRVFNTSGYRYGFNGKENDNEVKGEGSQQDYGMRFYDPRLGKFLSVDPLTKDYPSWSPYPFAMNSPISGVDLDGLEFYYAAEGKFLGKGSDPKSTEVRLAKSAGKTPSGNDRFIAVDINGKYSTSWVTLHQDHNTFLKFASAVNVESDGDKNETFAIASAFVNMSNTEYAKNRGATLDRLVSEENAYSYGVKKKIYEGYLKTYKKGKGNDKYALSAVVNALAGGEDFANGAVKWDGGDLVHKDWDNSNYNKKTSHRRWGILDRSNNDSMIELFNKNFKDKFGSNFVPLLEKASPDSNYGVEATMVHGGTIFFKPNKDSKKPESQVLSFQFSGKKI